MSSTDKAVVVADLRKSFGSVTALRGISFEVGRGEVLGLLGPNGAGKTTTVDILSTLATPDSGTAIVAGHDVRTDAAGVRRSIMLTGQHVALDDMLTGRQNLVMFGRLQGLRKAEARSRATELLERFDLVEAGDRSVKNYSGGMRRRIDIACGLVVRPEVVFLDEPTTGLHFEDVRKLLEVLHRLVDQGNSVVVIEHNLDVIKTADWLLDLGPEGGVRGGELVAEGTPETVAKNPRSFTGHYLKPLLTR
jgi:ABC-2 type transport system ATP-binding protein